MKMKKKMHLIYGNVIGTWSYFLNTLIKNCYMKQKILNYMP